MPYPAALGQRPLEVQEAYEALQQYAADYGREPLLLLMHAAVPQTLRPDLLALIRQNFRPRSRHDASLDADVLFAPLTTALGGGYYRIDAQVRWHALGLLRSRYRDDPRLRTRRVAELLWCYVESSGQRARRAADPLLAEFLDVQRWVALSFLEPAGAAQAFADALRQAGDAAAGGTVALRLGGLSAAIELPLGHRPELLAYARGLDALVDGDEPRARELLAPLGDAAMQVGEVVLEAPAALLQRRFGVAPGPQAEGDQKGQARHTCLLVLRDPALAVTVERELNQQGFDCREFNAGDDPRTGLRAILSADLVVCSVPGGDPNSYYWLGVCLALRAGGVIVVGASAPGPSLGLGLRAMLSYADASGPQLQRFSASLGKMAADPQAPALASAVYRAAPQLSPPVLDGGSAPAAAGLSSTCVVVQTQGREAEQSGRAASLAAAVYESIRQTVRAARLECVRLGEGVGDPTERLRLLCEASVVIVDLAGAGPEVLFAAGIRHGLRPAGTIVVSDSAPLPALVLAAGEVVNYPIHPPSADSAGWRRFGSRLSERLHATANETLPTSPVYQALPGLRPATWVPKRRRVFLSYVREYLPLARALAEGLAPTLDVDWDMKLEAGEVWQTRLDAMLDGADAVIALAGRQMRDRPFPIAEMRRAIERGKRLIPVFVDAFEAPGELSGRMCANVDPDGRILYLGELEGEALQHAIALTARNIVAALDAPVEAPAPQRYPLVVYTPAQLLSGDEPTDLAGFAWRFLAVGGSWFSIGTLNPAKNSNLLFQMVFGRRASAINCALPGARLSRVVGLSNAPEFAELLHGRRAMMWDALLLSVGGDDLFDAVDPPYRTADGRMVASSQRLLLTPSEWTAPEAGAARYISEEGWAAFDRYLLANLENVIRLRDGGPSRGVPIFLHGYPVPTPRPAGAGPNIGPWLLPAFERCGVPSADHAALAAALVERLNGTLQRAADDVKVFRQLHFFDPVDAGLLPASPSADGPSGDWATEIHPTRAGFAKLAAAWSASIEAVLGAAS